MKFKRRIKMITVIVLLLVLGVGGGLPGNPADVFAAGDKTDPSEDEEDTTGDEEDPSGDEEDSDEEDPSGDKEDPFGDKENTTGDETDPSEGEEDPFGDETDTTGDEMDSPEDEEDSSILEMVVPIYDYDILNVLVPTSYTVAFNPYGLDVSVGEDEHNV